MTTETIYTYPDGRSQRLGTDLDAVPRANATERTAPRATVPVDRSALVALLDAWQAFEDTRYSRLEPEGRAYWRQQREIAQETLIEALAAFSEAVDL